MNESDYIVTLAPMRTKLKLKGHACDLFALIYGYSKDGENTCRASLTYLAEWLGTDRHAVSKLIKRLEKAGYINKHEYLRGDMKCYEYTSNYAAMLAKAERGEQMGLATVKSVVKNTTVVKTTQKCCQNDHESVVKMTTNNTIENNIYTNSSFCASPAEQEQEKEDFYKVFFFRNAADPAVEVERFIAYNESLGWTNSQGRRYETSEQRTGLAKFWKIQSEGQWARQDYLNAVKEIYDRAVKEDISGADALINHKVKLVWNGLSERWDWDITAEARRWVEDNRAMVHEALDPILRCSSVRFRMIK